MESSAAPTRVTLDEAHEWLCLDVVNAVDGRDEDATYTYAQMLDWVRGAGGLTTADVAELEAAAQADPEAAADEVRRMTALLRSAFATFHALATDGRADEAPLAALQSVHADALAHGRLEASTTAFRWTWEHDLRLPRWLVAHSAIELVTRGPLGRVKVCASDDGCNYLFVDTSKNGSRRWCSMADCGNTAKSKRLTQKRRATRAATR